MNREDQARQALVQIGAVILGRYRHPDSWQAEYSDDGDWRATIETYVLRVEELNPQVNGLERARTFARAIRFWSHAAGLLQGQITVREPHLPVRGRDNNTYQPLISVPKAVWPQVLPLLQQLKA